MNETFSKFKTPDWLVGIGVLVALIAMFLPWYSVSINTSGVSGVSGVELSSSVDGFHNWGILSFIAILAVGGLFALRTFGSSNQAALPVEDWLAYAIGGGVIVLGAVIFWLETGGGESNAYASAGPDFGLFIAIAAGIAVAAGGIMLKSAAASSGAGTTPSTPAPPAP